MAKITIKNLTESVDLDRQAMLAVYGGARTRGYRLPVEQNLFRSTRIVDYPAGFSGHFLTSKNRLIK